jgi:hypothetical protein
MLHKDTRFVRVVGWRHLPELSGISLTMRVRVDTQAIFYNYARRLTPRQKAKGGLWMTQADWKTNRCLEEDLLINPNAVWRQMPRAVVKTARES